MLKTLIPSLSLFCLITSLTLILSGCGSKSDEEGGGAQVSESSSAMIQEEIAELNLELNGSEIYQLSSEEIEVMLAEGVITAEEANDIRLLLN